MNFLLDIYNELTNQKLKYSYTSFLMELFLGNNNIGIGTQKYIWLINNTKFAEVVLQSLIDLKDYNLLSLYFSKIFFLSLPNSNDNDNDYIPEFDIKYFFDRLELIINSKNEEDNEKLFDVISSQIINLINYKNINKSNSGNVIIDVILKYSIPNKILSIINSKKYAKNIQYKLINFLDNIFNINNKYSLNIPIVVSYQLDIENNFNLNDTNTYGIKYKIYLLSLKYENNIDEYNKKLKIITYNIDDCMSNKLIVEVFIYCDLILKSILINNRLKNINDISDENISKINNIFIQISTYLTNDNFDLIIKFIFHIIDFNYKFNQHCIKYKQKYSKIIIKEKTLILFIKNCFIQLNDFSLKEQLINKIIFNGRELNQNNSKFTHKKEYIMEKPFLTAILLKNLSDIKDYKSVCFIFNYLNEITNY